MRLHLGMGFGSNVAAAGGGGGTTTPTWTNAVAGNWTLTNSNRTATNNSITGNAYTEAGQGTIDILITTIGENSVRIGFMPTTSSDIWNPTTDDSGTPHVIIQSDGYAYVRADGSDKINPLSTAGTWVDGDAVRIGWNGTTKSFTIYRSAGNSGTYTLLGTVDLTADAGVVANMRGAVAGGNKNISAAVVTILPTSSWA